MASSSKEQELAIKIAGKVENSFKQSIGMGEDGLNRLANAAKKAAAVAASAFAALQIAEFAGDCVNAAMEYESAMADVAKVVDGLKDENGNLTESYHEMSDAILDMSKNIPMTAEELSQIMAAAGTAGIATEDLTRFTEVAAKMGVAFDSTAEQAGEWMAIWRTALGLTQDEVEVLGDQINYLGNTSSENALKLSQIVTDIGSLAKISGVSASELAAIGAATTGIDANVAATGLKNMFVAMGQGTQATEKQQKILEKLGFTSTEVAERMQIDSKGMILDLLESINQLPKAEQEAAISGYFGKESLATIAVLAGNLDNLKDQFEKVGDAAAYTGSMEAEYANRAATSANNVQLLENRMNALKIQLGTYLLPVLNTVLGVLSTGIDVLAMLADSSEGAFDQVTVAVEAVANVVDDFFQGILDGKSIVDALGTALETNLGVGIPPEFTRTLEQAQGVLEYLGETGTNAFSNIKQVIEENSPVFESIIQLVTNLKDRLFEAFEHAKPTITFIAETALPAIVDALLLIVGGATDVLNAFVEWEGFIPTVTTLATAIAGFKLAKTAIEIAKVTKAMTLLRVAKIKDKAETLYLNALYANDAIVKAASTAATWAQTAATTAWNVVCTAATAVTTALGAAFTFLTSPIGLVILAIGAVIAIGVLLYKNWDTVKEKAAQLGEWVSAKFSALKEAVCNAIDGFKDKFPVAFEFIKGVFDGWWTTVKGIIDGVKQTFQGIIDFVAGVFTGDWSRALDGLKNIFLGAFNALKSLALAPLNALKGVVTGAFNAIDTATGGKLTAIKEKASECWNNVKQTAGTVLQAAKDTVSEKLNNMKSAYEQHGGGIKGVAAAAIEGVKGYYTAGYTFIDNLTGGKLSSIKEKFTSKMGEVKASVSEAFNNVKDTAGNLMETARANVGAKLDAMKSAYDSAGGGIKGVVAGAMAGVKSTFSSVMSTVDTLTGGKLSSITSAFTDKLNAAKTAVTNVLGNIKQAFSDKLEAAKSVVTGALEKIKGAFNFKWSLPHLNLPHISVSGGKAPYGIAGKGSLPKFSIEWYKDGGIMTQPTAFGINPESGNLMAGGEAGPEAIVPLSQLWEKMTTILKGILAESQNGGAGNVLSALVDKVGAAMQGSTQTPISGLLDRLSGCGNEPQPATANGAPITYAPVYNFNGAAPTKDDLVEAERMSQAEFNEMMEQWQRDNDRKKF